MVNFNRVFLVGNLTRDPELRYTPQGTAVATLRLAINTFFKDKNSQTQKEVCFVNIVVWAQMAEICNQYLQKGRSVFVEGGLQSRSWQDSEGKNRSVLEVKASKVQFMPQGTKEAVKEVDLGDAPEESMGTENTNNQISGEAN